MAINVASQSEIAGKPAASIGVQTAFIAAWFFCLPFYFMQYAVRSAPSVVLPELTTAFGRTTLGVSSVLGLYDYTYSTFTSVAGASLGRWGPKYTSTVGVVVPHPICSVSRLASAPGPR